MNAAMNAEEKRMGSEPVYLAIRRKISEGIERGEYLPGSAIPSENELAQEFGTTRRMVRNAVNALVEQGTIRRVQGKGAFVTSVAYVDDSVLGGFREVARSSDGVPSVRVVGTSHRSAGPYYAELFGIDAGDTIYAIRRLNSVDGVPVSLENTLIPVKLFDAIEDVDISVFSLYETYEMQGRKVALAQERLDVEALGTRDAGLLHMEPGSLALVMESLSYDGTGQVIEYARSLNRGDRGGYIYQY